MNKKTDINFDDRILPLNFASGRSRWTLERGLVATWLLCWWGSNPGLQAWTSATRKGDLSLWLVGWNTVMPCPYKEVKGIGVTSVLTQQRPSLYQVCFNQKHKLRGRRPSTATCPACWAMGTRNQPRKDLLHLSSLSAHSPQFQQSAGANPLSSTVWF